jgi:spore maturation protein CgeB
VREHGQGPIQEFRCAYPGITSEFYEAQDFDAQRTLRNVDLAIVHEWTAPEIIRKIAAYRVSARGFRLLFHDTHHRAVSAPGSIPHQALGAFDGVLAYGRSLRDLYLRRGWARRAWAWHEAADTRVFRPLARQPEGDLVWIGNWGDGERSAELHEFLIAPVKALGLKASVYGVRYPEHARTALAAAGIEYRGWIANFKVPEVFARHRVTVHIPRRAYTAELPGIPTIRPFEALACGIPLVCSPWPDVENLFGPRPCYLTADDGAMMQRLLKELLDGPERARSLSAAGLETIRERHSCARRVDQLLAICGELGQERTGIDRQEVGA